MLFSVMMARSRGRGRSYAVLLTLENSHRWMDKGVGFSCEHPGVLKAVAIKTGARSDIIENTES
jgi:hypothetical protein